MDRPQQFCTFLLDGQFFGTPLAQVREVIPSQVLTLVPLADDAIAGVMNLRGQIVPAIDLRRRLGMPARAPDQPSMSVVIRHNAGEVSLLVDDIGDVLELESFRFELPPETIRGPRRVMISGVYKLERGVLHVLDTASICSVSAG